MRRRQLRGPPASTFGMSVIAALLAAMTDLIGGQISIVVTTTSDVLENHEGGKIRVLATSDATRSPFLPDIPTFKESGYNI